MKNKIWKIVSLLACTLLTGGFAACGGGSDSSETSNSGDILNNSDILSSSHKHTYTEVITKEATCVEAGEKTCTCECGEDYTEEISALGHDYENYVCIRCGDEIVSSEGLEYELSSDGTYYSVVGIGACKDENLIIPSTHNNLPVKTVGYEAFQHCSNLTSVVIPDSVTSVGVQGFWGCENLTSVVMGDGVRSIGSSAFFGCKSLINVVIPDGVTSIELQTFYQCSSLKSVAIPDSITTIGGSAFYYCSSLTGVVLPEGVTRIEYKAFQGCSSLKSVAIPDSLTDIEYDVFSECSSLASIEVSVNNSVYKSVDGILYTKDGKELIQYAIGKTESSFTIPDGVESIGLWAFWSCKNLTNVTIPNSVISIADGAFQDCSNLTNVIIPDSVTSIGRNAFNECSSFMSIVIPDSVVSIGYYAFYRTGYYNDESNWENKVLYIGKHLIAAKLDISGAYTIKEGTLCIVDGAFWSCTGLTSVIIPNSVKSIGHSTFSDCGKLNNVTFNGTVEQWKAIKKDRYWNGGYYIYDYIPATEVVCSDGKVSI